MPPVQPGASSCVQLTQTRLIGLSDHGRANTGSIPGGAPGTFPAARQTALGERGRTHLDRFRRDEFAALHGGRHARVVGRPRRPADLGRRFRLGLDDRPAGRVGGPDRAGRGRRADLATGGTGTRSAGRLAVGRRPTGRAGRPGCSRSGGIRPNLGLGDGQ